MSGVLVVVESRNGMVGRASLEAIAAGQLLARVCKMECCAAIIGGDPAQLVSSRLARIYAVDHPLLESYSADGYIVAIQQLVDRLRPDYVVFPHTYRVRDFAPAVAARFDRVLISDVIAIEAGPVFVRQLFQGKFNADYRAAGPGPVFVSVQAGSFSAEPLQTADVAAPVEAFAVELTAAQIRTSASEPFRESSRSVDLASAPVIVAVGRGIREQEGIALVQALADALGAELGASRPICDAGWLPMERQVGSSGQTVAPKLYLAVGISGAIQHLVGMKGAKRVIAINKDANAPIFEVADYGVAADLFEIVPALTKAILAAKA
jgi:electron transfer flavoprotein alpha subunit